MSFQTLLAKNCNGCPASFQEEPEATLFPADSGFQPVLNSAVPTAFKQQQFFLITTKYHDCHS